MQPTTPTTQAPREPNKEETLKKLREETLLKEWPKIDFWIVTTLAFGIIFFTTFEILSGNKSEQEVPFTTATFAAILLLLNSGITWKHRNSLFQSPKKIADIASEILLSTTILSPILVTLYFLSPSDVYGLELFYSISGTASIVYVSITLATIKIRRQLKNHNHAQKINIAELDLKSRLQRLLKKSLILVAALFILGLAGWYIGRPEANATYWYKVVTLDKQHPTTHQLDLEHFGVEEILDSKLDIIGLKKAKITLFAKSKLCKKNSSQLSLVQIQTPDSTKNKWQTCLPWKQKDLFDVHLAKTGETYVIAAATAKKSTKHCLAQIYKLSERGKVEFKTCMRRNRNFEIAKRATTTSSNALIIIGYGIENTNKKPYIWLRKYSFENKKFKLTGYYKGGQDVKTKIFKFNKGLAPLKNSVNVGNIENLVAGPKNLVAFSYSNDKIRNVVGVRLEKTLAAWLAAIPSNATVLDIAIGSDSSTYISGYTQKTKTTFANAPAPTNSPKIPSIDKVFDQLNEIQNKNTERLKDLGINVGLSESTTIKTYADKKLTPGEKKVPIEPPQQTQETVPNWWRAKIQSNGQISIPWRGTSRLLSMVRGKASLIDISSKHNLVMYGGTAINTIADDSGQDWQVSVFDQKSGKEDKNLRLALGGGSTDVLLNMEVIQKSGDIALFGKGSGYSISKSPKDFRINYFRNLLKRLFGQ